jgi:2'-5' RNA ligase
MRLFLAVDLDDSVRHAMQESAIALRQRLERLRDATRLTWVSPDRLHLTLLFLGEVSDEVCADVAARLTPALPLPPFDLRFGSVGMFPPNGRPRVLWLDVSEGREPLRALHAAVCGRLDGVPMEREGRAFSPHLTLARFREPGTMTERYALAEVPVRSCAPCRIDHVTLYQSRLSPKGPTYAALRRTPLVHDA